MIYFIILLAVLARLIPHMPNVAPVTALAIFSAVYLPKKQAIAIPLIARLVSDLILGFFSWPLMLAVYAAHLAGFGLGFWIKRISQAPSARQWLRIVASSLAASVLFYFVTNFALFYSTAFYPHTWQGIAAAYINGLPFLRGTAIGDLAYTAALFGAWQAVAACAARRKILVERAT